MLETRKLLVYLPPGNHSGSEAYSKPTMGLNGLESFCVSVVKLPREIVEVRRRGRGSCVAGASVN